MTLAEFSHLLGAHPKWVLNTLRAVNADGRYTVDMARQLFVARAVHEATAVPMAESLAVARLALRASYTAASPAPVPGMEDADVAMTVDVYRLLSSFYTRLAHLRASFAPRARGRPRTRNRSARHEAEAWGLDLSLMRDNLRKSPAERVRQLDAMGHFSRTVRRAGKRTTSP
ncbi:hypothetical protein [Gemmatimonas sp.]|uniref:hypothetical protein n=1 Tax=Gemmatimonas sp. TaxID=1962908 RepID=UPI00398381C1